MQYTSEQFLTISQACDACMVVESYINEGQIGQELKVKGSSEDITKMLGSLVACVGEQIVDISNPENFKRYLAEVEEKAIESLIKSLSGDVTKEYNRTRVL